RTLFTLPDLSTLSPFQSPEPQTYHERKILPYKRSALYDIVADVASYPRFVPFCVDTRIITPPSPLSPPSPTPPSPVHGKGKGVSMEAEMTVGFMAFKERYVSRVTCVPYESVEAVASSSTPLFRTLTTTWRFQRASPQSPHAAQVGTPAGDDGPTLVTLDLVYAFANPVHATISAAFFGQVSKLMVKAFEERCLEVYGPG
ncbi:hypothetical protein PLICRDRAFT_66100, partial [Plicaturopsis crispa FD-325 SS-3]